ncbi:S53 family peptidase [Cuniculiplasma sp. SKW4]|uniref:S53 family peptidase n=1 Tax=Cuniculiplasma sp. SKW4 TaxID=3400171 RepID=UPI003FD192FD
MKKPVFKRSMVTNALVFVIVTVMIFSSFSIVDQNLGSTKGSVVLRDETPAKQLSSQSYGMIKVPFAPGSLMEKGGMSYTGKTEIMVSFGFNNQSALNSYLSNISNIKSPYYHKYLTKNQFDQRFSTPEYVYNQAVNYFSSFSGLKVREFSDRISILIEGNASSLERAINTTFVTSSKNAKTYFATSAPELPSYIAHYVSEISGLTNSPFKYNLNLGISPTTISDNKYLKNGYIQPYNDSGVQLIYGSDLQKAYDEVGLLNITYPTNEVVATVLWSGNNSSGKDVAPFVKSNVCDYFNKTLPSYEPHPHVYGAPINGAPYPGPSAQYDHTGANYENTLDLEMVGSMAPGATIYNVYGPSPTLVNLLSAYAFILNPNSTAEALKNVSVITNSWGSSAMQNTSMKQYLEEAQARGITVLASSGDSGDNPKSSKYVGTINSFPAMCSYNDFGVTSVGGTTLTLNSNLGIEKQIAWNISSADTADSGPAGSAGGICINVSEPSWENNTMANSVIQGKGLGIPDLSAIGNNTLICISSDGTTGEAAVWGTSIASPVTAGMIAEMNAVLNMYNNSNVGFLNPSLFRIANEQLQKATYHSDNGAIDTGSYNSTLPMQVVYNVDTGNNYLYKAGYGYNLVTGWGSLNDYNFTVFLLNRSFNGKIFAMDGVRAYMNLSGLNVTSYLFNSTSNKYTINSFYNASIQENLFLANSLGAPIYWIQNVIYINGSQKTGWIVNYTGWKIAPFYGLYPDCAVYSYDFPAGKLIHFPHDFEITTWLENYTSELGSRIYFSVNNQTLSLPVPGAKYVIGSYNYSYEWNGNHYYNGPYPDNNASGGLDPQIGLVGGPSLGIGNFTLPTGGTLKFLEKPMGMNDYKIGSIKPFSLNVDETGESSKNLVYTEGQNGQYNLSIRNGSTEQGLLTYQVPGCMVTFSETGLGKNIPWYVNITGENSSGPIMKNQYVTHLSNGTYTVKVQSQGNLYSATYNRSFTIKGNPLSLDVIFSPYYTKVTFNETHLPNKTEWFVNLSNGNNSSSSTGNITFSLLNGSYSYTVSSLDKNLRVNSSSFNVQGVSLNIKVSFIPVLCDVNFTENGLPYGAIWYVNVSGQSGSGPIEAGFFNMELENGSYTAKIQTGDKMYHPVYVSGFTVNGSKRIQVQFLPTTYRITFAEHGIPNNTEWYLNLTGTTNEAQANHSEINMSLTNGTYDFIGSAYENARFSANGTFTVNGSNLTVSVNFSRAFLVLFQEEGLKSGLYWSVHVSNGLGNTTKAGQSISFYLTNGSYQYTAMASEISYHAKYNSDFRVSGLPVTLNVTFVQVKYRVTFTETGIPNGTVWYVNINSINVSSSSSSFIWGNLTNGTYSFSLYSKGYVSNSTSSFTVNGSNVVIHVTFNRNKVNSGFSVLLIILPVIAALIIVLFYFAFRKRKW